MLEYVREIVQKIEVDPKVQGRDDAFVRLRALGIDDFGELLWSMPNPDYPKLSALLPKMASDEVQWNWTGNAGSVLIRQTAAFIRSMSYNFNRLTGRQLDNATVLDFGCGYGRMARLMYRFTNSERFFAVDPWDKSIEICREAGLETNFFVSDYLPESLPVGQTKFDLIYAFSVFTHLSERAALTSLRTLRKYISDTGMLAITIRPIEYWPHDQRDSEKVRQQLMRSHRDTGFAYRPHNRPPVDGDITYGDTSMTLDWLLKKCPEWVIHETDRSLEDALQRYVFLSPKI